MTVTDKRVEEIRTERAVGYHGVEWFRNVATKELLEAYDRVKRELKKAEYLALEMSRSYSMTGDTAIAIAKERDELKAGIRRHRDEKGHDRCYLDDDRLYALLGEPIPLRPLPPRDEFLAGCAQFYELRRKGVPEEAFDRGLAAVIAQNVEVIGILEKAIEALRRDVPNDANFELLAGGPRDEIKKIQEETAAMGSPLCLICGESTTNTGTRLCHPCWELHRQVKMATGARLEWLERVVRREPKWVRHAPKRTVTQLAAELVAVVHRENPGECHPASEVWAAQIREVTEWLEKNLLDRKEELKDIPLYIMPSGVWRAVWQKVTADDDPYGVHVLWKQGAREILINGTHYRISDSDA